MRLGSLRLLGFRRYRDTTFRFHPEVNLVTGPNACGKTTLIEAVYYLGHLQSFRSSLPRTLIRKGEDQFTITHRDGSASTLGISYRDGRHRIRQDGAKVERRSELLRRFPQFLLHPGSHAILEQGPLHRRRFMDQVLFHVEQEYHALILRYHHLLRQRNASLRKGDPALAESWDDQLADLGESITRHRRAFIRWLCVNQDRSPLFELFAGMEVVLQPGWNEGEPLRPLLATGIGQDLKLKMTRRGPHKADILFLQQGLPARHRLSRGQSKLFLLHLVILSIQYLQAQADIVPLLLVDDFSSELDPRSLDLALGALPALVQTSAQVLITSTRDDLPTLLSRRQVTNCRVFHVEQGSLRKMV